MSDYVPHELLVDILARLPVISVLRFRSVCKSWYSLFSTSDFVTKHINHGKKNPDKILLGVYNYNTGIRYLLCRDNEQFGDEFSELELPFEVSSRPPNGRFYIVGSVDGILCGLDISTALRIILWNPSTRKLVTLPEPEEATSDLIIGFGVHPTTHEYKVVKIRRLAPDYSKVDVYTQATGWRGSGSTYPCHCFVGNISQHAFVNGAVNWLGRGPRVREMVGSCYSIVSFDMGAETFSELTLPPMLANQKIGSLSVKVFEGSRALLCHRQGDDGSCCLWVMKEYRIADSWTKLFSFKLDVPVILERALGFRKHAEVLLMTRDSQFLSYDIGNRALTNTGIWKNAFPFYVEPFLETLVSVETQNGLLNGQWNPW